MTDVDLVEKKLAFVTTCVTQLRTLARLADLATDIREQRFVEHTLQLAIQAVIDVASHIASDDHPRQGSTSVQRHATVTAERTAAPASCR